MKAGARKGVLVALASCCCTTWAQDCKLLEEKPIASTQQGGYSFDYYSGRGTLCRIYKLRNHPGRLKTPVLWRSATEVFFETALLECPGSFTSCAWLTVTKTAWKPYDEKSLLSYGVNKDEYKENPETYVEAQRQASISSSLLPLITTISGPITDAWGKPVEIGIRVASYATRNAENGFRLRYVFNLLPEGAETEIGTISTKAEGAGITVVWQSMESPSFANDLAKMETRKLKPELTVEMVSPSIEVGWNPLILTQGGKRIFSTTAPAYRAKEN